MTEEFIKAVESGMTCKDCKHFQLNKMVQDRIIDESCYHEDAMQSTYYLEESMKVTSEFLCNRFEQHESQQIRTDWRDNLSEEHPVLCWVWNYDNKKRIVAVEAFDKKDKSYYANRNWYLHAVPLTKEEALKYIIEE